MNLIASWLSQGVRDAAGKIRMLSRSKVDLSEGTPRSIDIVDVGAVLGGDDQLMCAIGMNLMARAPLVLMIVMSPAAMTRFAVLLAGPAAETNPQLAHSVLQEVGNVFGTSIANCLSRYLGSTVRTSVPEYWEDMAGALASVALGSMDSVSDSVVLLDTEMHSSDVTLPCSILMLADPSIENIFKTRLEQMNDDSSEMFAFVAGQ